MRVVFSSRDPLSARGRRRSLIRSRWPRLWVRPLRARQTPRLGGTKVSFELKQEGHYSIVLFTHLDWREPVEFMRHCSTKWAILLMSLKALVETGKGAPSPGDVQISKLALKEVALRALGSLVRA